jgi:hypothetical protein
MNTRITHVTMDTHKKQHKVAMMDQQTGEIQEFTVKNMAKGRGKSEITSTL